LDLGGKEMTKLMMYVVMFLCLGIVLCGTAQANLLVNGDFEQGEFGQLDGTTVVPGWTYWQKEKSGWHCGDGIYRYGDKSVAIWWDDLGMYQDVFGITVGQTYKYELSVINPSIEPLKGWDLVVKAEWTNDIWATVGSSEIGRFLGTKSTTDLGDGIDTWKLISGTAVAPEGATHGKIFLQLVHTGDWGYTGGKVYLDNANVVLVPEPATMMLLGLGSLIFIKRRK
jgi:hypothetical protein